MSFAAYLWLVVQVWWGFATLGAVGVAVMVFPPSLVPAYKRQLLRFRITPTKRWYTSTFLLALAFVLSSYSIWKSDQINKNTLLNKNMDLTRNNIVLTAKLQDKQDEIDKLLGKSIINPTMPVSPKTPNNKQNPVIIRMPGPKERQDPAAEIPNISDPDALYQLGVKVGYVIAAKPQLDKSNYHFETMIFDKPFDISKGMVYRNFELNSCNYAGKARSRSAGRDESQMTDVNCAVSSVKAEK